MINNADKRTIAEIFGIENSLKYVIPKYQREYTWTKENWDELLDDVLDSDGSHFIGSIICIRNDTLDTLATQELELVDGQQRLTTISLIFCALYKLLNDQLKNSENEDLKLELGNLKWRLAQKQNKSELKLEPSEQNSNFLDYKFILAEVGIIEAPITENKNKGNRKIYKAYRYFLKRMEDYDTKQLLDLLNRINRVILVKIEVNSHSDAFLLFESLNNRGVPLSAIDLIKNKMLSVLENKDKKGNNVETAFKQWNKIINNLPNYSDQERFLRHFYNAFKFKDKIKVSSIPKALKSNLIKVYETLINQDPQFILDELINASCVYSDLINPSDGDSKQQQCTKELHDLYLVGAAPSYVLLLYLFSLKLDDAQFYKDTIDFLTKYFLRRNITDFPNTRNLDAIFMDLIKDIEANKRQLSADYIAKHLSAGERMSNMNSFTNMLVSDLYEVNVDMTRFILSKIEEAKSKTREIYVDFWERDKSNKLIWTIEHIFPEGANMPEPWVQMIANGDKDKAKEIQTDWVHKLGNLTLTGYNQNLSNFNFVKKRDRQDNNKKYIGYKNGLFLNEDLKDKDAWRQEDIENRTAKLAKLAAEVFKLRGE